MKTQWTVEEFYTNVGRYPEDDDLERTNCLQAGKTGHQACGICEKHNKPVFMCPECFVGSDKPDFKRKE